jgi:hypothetical protein
MSEQPQSDLETDPRFPSGPWTGFFLQRARPGRHWMELHLTFQAGTLTGEGRDWVGKFIFRGRYSTADGKCHWTKRYLGQHDVYYQGYNEGKGIWGTWEIHHDGLVADRGGFHIWPKGMADPTQQHLTAAAPVPEPVSEEVVEKSEKAEPALAPS